MLLLISPAKSLDFESEISCKKSTSPFFEKEAEILNSKLKKLSVEHLKKLMGISLKLAELNHQRFQNFKKEEEDQTNFRQALLAFDGNAYLPIKATYLDEDDITFAQNHLRILSGLYGLLRPLDLIQPYRLEMGSSFTNEEIFCKIGVKNLYSFWGKKISQRLEEEAKILKSTAIINLASEEYLSAIQRDSITLPIIDIHFKEEVKGQLKIIGIKAKKARGMMASFVIRNRLSNPNRLEDFREEGYRFSKELSAGKKFVFVREELA